MHKEILDSCHTFLFWWPERLKSLLQHRLLMRNVYSEFMVASKDSKLLQEGSTHLNRLYNEAPEAKQRL